MKRKSTLLLLPLVILIASFFGCKKDNTDTTPINGGVVFTSQLVFISTTDVTEEQYTATLGDVSVNVLKINDTVAAFQVPGSFAVGNTKLIVPDLNNLTVNYEVKKTVLANTPDIVLKELFDNLDAYLAGIGSDPDAVYVQSVLGRLEDYYNAASESDKTKMAIYYQANKELFNGIINDDFTLQRIGDLGSLGGCLVSLLKFGASALPFSAGVAVAWLAPDPVEKLIALGVAAIGWRYMKIHYVAFSDCTMKAVNFVIDGISSSVNGRLLNSYVNYTDDIALSSSFSDISRGVTGGDRGSSAGANKFFTVYDLANSSITKLNSVIVFVNTNIPFTNIDLLDPFVVADTQTETEGSVTEDVFNAMSFTVASSNVSIKSKSFSDGNINLTMKINDPSAVAGDYIETELNYSYSDYFNTISGKFPIRVNKQIGISYWGGTMSMDTHEMTIDCCDRDGNPATDDCGTGGCQSASRALFGSSWGSNADISFNDSIFIMGVTVGGNITNYVRVGYLTNIPDTGSFTVNINFYAPSSWGGAGTICDGATIPAENSFLNPITFTVTSQSTSEKSGTWRGNNIQVSLLHCTESASGTWSISKFSGQIPTNNIALFPTNP